MNEVSGFNDTIAWYNENAEQYADIIRKIPSHSLLDRFSEGLSEGAKILDAGCAGGRDCEQLGNRGLIPVGLDISEGLLAAARTRYSEINFVEGNFLSLPFGDEEFDGVWAHASLLHFETPDEVERSIKEFRRVLKPKGLLHIFVKQQQGEAKTEIVSDKLSGHNRFFQWFTKSEIEDFLSNNGFVNLDVLDEITDPAGRDEVKWIAAFAIKA